MKKATATNHGNKRLTDSSGVVEGAETALEGIGFILIDWV
jgi:hypothetical protein